MESRESMWDTFFVTKGLTDEMEGLPGRFDNDKGDEAYRNIDMVVVRHNGVLVIGFCRSLDHPDSRRILEVFPNSGGFVKNSMNWYLEEPKTKVGKPTPPPRAEPLPITDKPRSVTAADLGLSTGTKLSKYQRRKDKKHKYATRR